MKNFFYESIDGNLDKLSSERNLRSVFCLPFPMMANG